MEARVLFARRKPSDSLLSTCFASPHGSVFLSGAGLMFPSPVLGRFVEVRLRLVILFLRLRAARFRFLACSAS
jgi:S-adenosylmethionine:tRNA-ribosyltransferase-isomerase (queuine synthetase)